MPEISAGHPITKAFLPHQRVTTEGKAMEWIKCSERQPLKNRLLLLFVDGDYEFGKLQEDDFWIYTNGAFKKRYAPQEVTHWAMLNHPE